MPSSLNEVLNLLDQLARYDGAWRELSEESRPLKRRVGELRERSEHLHDVLVVALVGGSGVGKSTFLNALAGDELAKTSPYRPCTSQPTVYAPPGVLLPFQGWNHVTGSALEHLVVIDTPDSDTIVHEHRERTLEVLRHADLILLCASSEKYLDEATWSLLRPLKDERTFICVETKAASSDPIRAHWQARLKEQGFETERYFRVNALKSFDRKVSGGHPEDDEIDFPALEKFLADELTAERIERIKRSNVSGLLRKTTTRLNDLADTVEPALEQVERRIGDSEQELAREALQVIERRLFQETHLWSYALGREVGLRAKGIVGTASRALEALRTLPARVGSWMPGVRRPSAGKQAADALSAEPLFTEDLEIAGDEIRSFYSSYQKEVALQMTKSGLNQPDSVGGDDDFVEALNHRVTHVLRGSGRDAIIKRAAAITSWPVTVLCDAPLVLLVLFSAYRIFATYFFSADLPNEFVSLSAAVWVIVLLAELVALGGIAQYSAWSVRQHALNALRVSFLQPGIAYQQEREHIESVRSIVQKIRRLAEVVS